MEACKALVNAGVNPTWLDDVGKLVFRKVTGVGKIADFFSSLPAYTLMDCIISSSSSVGVAKSYCCQVAILFGLSTEELWNEYISSRRFASSHLHCLPGLGDVPSTESCANVDVEDSSGRSALAWAVEFGMDHVVEHLLQQGSDPNQRRRSFEGSLPVLQTAFSGPMGEMSSHKYLQTAKLLVENGADINATDHQGWSAVHIAASWGSWEVLHFLCSLNGVRIDWHSRTSKGESIQDMLDQSQSGFTVEDIIKSCS